MQPLLTSGPDTLQPFRHPALVIAHPGHELRVFGWLSQHRPLVYVITDGSGQRGVSRLHSTESLLRSVGSRPAEIFGHVADRRIYRAILDGDSAFFVAILDRLSRSLVTHGIDMVAGDATEGYNPTHDICRALVDAAALQVRCSTGRTLANYELNLTEWDQGRTATHDARCLHLLLSDDLLKRKLEAAENYVEMRDEARKAVAACGQEYFRVECLRRSIGPEAREPNTQKPYYETWGEKRVEHGLYGSVIRYREHIRPIIQELFRHAAQHGASVADHCA
jgi:hypothetical protein